MMLRTTLSALLLAVSAAATAGYNGNIDPVSAFDWLNADEYVVLLDVRTAEEWRWVGHPGPNGLADSKGKGLAYNSGAGLIASGEGANVVNISYRVASVTQGATDSTTPIYEQGLPINPDFVAAVEDELGNLQSAPTLLLMCRSGSRAEEAAELLGDLGYDTWNIEGGFEGTSNTSEYPGPDTGYRDVNGWRNAKLPWNQDPSGGYNKVLIMPLPTTP